MQLIHIHQRSVGILALTCALLLALILSPGTIKTTAAHADEPLAVVDINDVPIAVGDPEPGAVGDESTHNVGQGVFLPYPGSSRGYWAGAFSNPRGVPPNLASSIWWCMTVGPWQALEFTEVYEARAAALSYVFATKQEIDTPVSRAAIGTIIHGQYDTGSDVRPREESRSTWQASAEQNYPEVAALAAAYLAEGERLGAPYATSGFAVTALLNSDGKPELTEAGHPLWSVSGIGVTSRSGAYVPGHEITLTIDGHLEWEAGGKQLTVTSAAEALTARAVATGNGPATVTMTVAKTLPGETVVIGSQPGHQTMVSEKTEKLGAQASATVDVTLQFRPEAVSTVEQRLVDDGVIADSIAVSAEAGQVWLSRDGAPIPVVFDGTAYGTGDLPPEQSADIPADAPVLGTVQLTANRGPGSYGPVKLEGVSPQFVTWVWEVRAESQQAEFAEFIDAGWRDDYGVPDETSSVRRKIEIISSLSVRETAEGIFLVDDQWRKGFTDSHPDFTGTDRFAADAKVVTSSLHFIPGTEWPTAESCTADTLQAETTSPASNGFEPVSAYSFKVDESLGEGTWVVVHDFAGDDRVQPFTSRCDDRTQSYRVEIPEREVTVTTKVHTQNGKTPVAGDGGALLDTHIISGDLEPGDGGVSELYFVPTGTELVCSTETLVWTSDRLNYEEAVSAGHGTWEITTGPYAYGDQAGTYSYIEEATDKDGKRLDRGRCGESSETIVVAEKPVTPPVTPPTVPPTTPPTPTTPRVPLATTGGSSLMIPSIAALALLTAGAALLHFRRKRTHSRNS